MAVANERVWMLENSIYSILSPEACSHPVGQQEEALSRQGYEDQRGI